MRGLLRVMLRCYLWHFPIQHGKWRLWRRCREWLEWNNGRVVTQTIRRGIRMRLRLWDDLDRFIYFWGCWEPNETWVLEQTLKPGDVFVDVGANTGYFSLLASKLVGSGGRVIAFEPCPEAVARFKENLDLNGAKNIVLHEYAVSDQAGEVRLARCSGRNLGMATIRPLSSTCPTWRVPCVTLDVALADVPNVRLVKIDVEGAELRVLKGFSRFLRTAHAPSLLCEITGSFIETLGGTADEVYDLLGMLGYRAWLCDRMQLAPADAKNLLSRDQVNAFFAKPSSDAATYGGAQ